jgi:hypothetical protein
MDSMDSVRHFSPARPALACWRGSAVGVSGKIIASPAGQGGISGLCIIQFPTQAPTILPFWILLEAKQSGRKTMKLLKITLALCLFAGLAAAEDRMPAKTVRVVGTSEVKVVPDRAVIEVGVEKQALSASVAKHAEDAAARRILVALRGNGIDEKDIQTTFLSLQPQSSYVKKVRVSYFVAQQTLTVTVRDITKLDTLLETLIKAGGNRIDSIGYETSELRKYRDQARDMAVKAAREKAEALAKALGQEIGKAQSIEEVPEPENAYFMANASLGIADKTRSAGPSVAVGQKTISASVMVSFELN